MEVVVIVLVFVAIIVGLVVAWKGSSRKSEQEIDDWRENHPDAATIHMANGKVSIANELPNSTTIRRSTNGAVQVMVDPGEMLLELDYSAEESNTASGFRKGAGVSFGLVGIAVGAVASATVQSLREASGQMEVEIEPEKEYVLSYRKKYFILTEKASERGEPDREVARAKGEH